MIHPLPIALEVSVRLQIMEWEQCSGPELEDFERCRWIGQYLAEKGDVLQFGSKKKGEVAKIFNKLAAALAVMAFAPGGVEVFGIHFEAKV